MVCNRGHAVVPPADERVQVRFGDKVAPDSAGECGSGSCGLREDRLRSSVLEELGGDGRSCANGDNLISITLRVCSLSHSRPGNMILWGYMSAEQQNLYSAVILALVHNELTVIPNARNDRHVSKSVSNALRDESIEPKYLGHGPRISIVEVVPRVVARPHDKVDLALEVRFEPVERRVGEIERCITVTG